ncbi:ATP-binding protein [Pedobacter sp. D749]|uniref:ATP-binding protein n=1 Tax=Pedobacter sp. D749 TaxID=2856523 RepID=UPI001C574325|nr:ATP-binding protein [Pedobacter sp. D749]QXU43478.1 ATP-binding protein [Pedobacter sp. D749]
MQLLHIKFLSDYKQFKKDQLITFSTDDDEQIESYILKISVLVGRNGSGKTTLMSIIAQFFHHIERYNGKIPADIEICYVIGILGRSRTVTLIHQYNLLRISIGDTRYKNMQVIPKKNPHEWDNKIIDSAEPAVTFDEIAQYMPTSIVTSVFSMHGEYPNPRPGNYEGRQLLADRSITRMYGDNHFDLGSISRGIVRFLRMYLAKGSRVKSLLGLFDLKFNDRVLTKDWRRSNGNDAWVDVDRKWLAENDVDVQMEHIFLNDIEFKRGDRLINLSNMSSGEKMLLLRAISILDAIEQNSLVIIEEPELHLDPVWNRQLVTLFRTFFSSYRAHILIATHDYSLIKSIPPSRLVFLNQGRDEAIKNTYLASYDDLFSTLYGGSYRPNKVEQDLLKSIESKPLAELKDIFSEMGNSLYKYLVFKKIAKLEEDVEGN